MDESGCSDVECGNLCGRSNRFRLKVYCLYTVCVCVRACVRVKWIEWQFYGEMYSEETWHYWR
jgi:hypothetical protein